MGDINTVNLINQMRAMATQAEGAKVEASANQTPFNLVFQNALNQVNDLTQTSDSLKTRFELGDPNVSLGEVMIASQKSNLGFEATLRVRNKVVQAYQGHYEYARLTYCWSIDQQSESAQDNYYRE